MSQGLFALLDDVAAIAKVAAASLDDAAGQAAKASSKAAGVVIDDAAVTPKYVVGFAADRELPIVVRIAKGSLKTKLLMLLPGALVLSAVAPWALNPLLIIGGAFLCSEGFEKVLELVGLHAHDAEQEAAPAAVHRAPRPAGEPRPRRQRQLHGRAALSGVLLRRRTRVRARARCNLHVYLYL